MKYSRHQLADREAGDSLFEMVILTLMILIGAIIIFAILLTSINHQSRAAQQHSTCITNVSTGACR